MPSRLLLSLCLLFSANLSAQTRVYVSQSSAGQNNGLNWDDAFVDLQDALHQVSPGAEIWVAQGTYFATADSNRSISFELPSGMRLLGGFSGTETDISQRDWNVNETILSGDIGVSGDSIDNTYNVIYLEMPDSNTLIDGFTIRDGVANNDALANDQRDRFICGGGIYAKAGNWEALPTIQNCRIVHNTASNIGGGAMFFGSNDADVMPTFNNCVFENNHSLSLGGAMARFGGTWTERGIDFDACDFINNQAGLRGGGIYYVDGSGDNSIGIQNCSFIQNNASLDGGGAHFFLGKSGKSGLHILNSIFEANSANTGSAFRALTNGGEFSGNFIIDSSQFVRHNSITKSGLVDIDLLGNPQYNFEMYNSRFFDNQIRIDLIIPGFNYANIKFEKIKFDNNSVLYGLFNLSGFSSFSMNSCSFIDNECTSIGIITNPAFAVEHEIKLVNILFKKNNFTANFGMCDLQGFKKISLIHSSFLFQQSPNGLSPRIVSNAIDSLVLTNSILTQNLNTNPLGPIGHIVLSNNYFGSINCATLPSNITCGTGMLSGIDPMFRDTANGDYALLPCSPLIDAGSNAAAVGIPTDITGAPRLQGGTVDIGTYESAGLSLATPPLIKAACSNTSGGSIDIEPVNGCEPYTYTWSPQAVNGPNLNDLPPGNYQVTIMDSRGRSIIDTLAVPAAPSPLLEGIATDVQCGTLSGGTATASVSSGTAPFTFLWSTGASNSLLTMLPSGEYKVTVTDAFGCQDSTQLSILRHGQLTLMVDGNPITCFGDMNGELSATPVTGKAPFSYQWSQGSVDSLLTGLGPGDYAVTVTDVYSCTSTFNFHLEEPLPLQTSASATPSNNLQSPNGTATVNAQGGMPTYTYAWSNGGAGQMITGLAPGAYTVTATDANGCTSTTTAVVEFVSGTVEAEAFQVQVWPNPMAEKLEAVISGFADHQKLLLSLQDALGRQVGIVHLTNGHAVLDVRILPKGNYVWVLWMNGQVVQSGNVVK